jgi:hypothetical protein
MRRAVRERQLQIRRERHHAVVLEHDGARLVTADDRYYARAKSYGTITALHDWVLNADIR